MIKRFIFRLAVISTDKYLHFICGLIIAQVVTQLLDRRLPWWAASALGLLAAVVAGVAKEYYDKKHGELPECQDALATALGGLLGILLLLFSL